jgi:ATP synthase protein I
MNTAKIGKWAFILGLVIAVLAGLFYQPAWSIWVLAILGVIVGFLNVSAEDTRGFLLAAIAFTLSATALNTLPIVGTAFSFILPLVVAFVAGATIVVAFKELFQTARTRSS